MNNKFSILFLVSLLFSATALAATTEELTVTAISPDKDVATESIADLRAMGVTGLDALFAKYAADIDRYKKTGEADENWKRIAAALDTVAMQKDDYTSQLFWYTDLDAAKRVAKAQNKPILSLRLLGNLNEEFSWANSRLFRAIL